MGYDILGNKTKNGKTIAHVSCPYAWEPHFKRALGCDIQSFNGKIIKDDVFWYLESFASLKRAVVENDIQQFRGNLANCSKETLVQEFEELIDGISNRTIRYLNIG